MSKISKSNLGYLGEPFQYELVHHLMEDKEFFKDLYEILDQNLFTNINLKIFIAVMKDHYSERDSVPSYSTMATRLNARAVTVEDKEIYEATLEKIRNTKEDSPDTIHDLALRFFRQQNIIKACNKCLTIAGNGDAEKYEECVETLSDALKQGEHDELGSTVFDDIGETLSEDYRITIPTGINLIDKTLEGGLAKGELGVIVGPSSFGKTSLTTAMASYAATYRCEQNDFKGFKVLQVVFEDRIKQIQRKHLARIASLVTNTEIEAKDLSKEGIKPKVDEILANYEEKDMMRENLRIVRFPSGEITAPKIKRYIKKLTNSGFKPDLVIIDYFECIESTDKNSNGNEYESEGRTMRKFEAMVGELNCAMWIPVQGTKDSVSQEVVTMDKAGGSFKKIQIAHIIMSIARTTEDIKNNRANIAILKNRAGKSGVIFKNAKFNNGTCIVECSEENDEMDFATFKEEKAQQVEDLQISIMRAMKAKKSAIK